ncbi:hypothetical protein [Fusobacterium varium]|uniref:hypothetical protein n=1 Tax=Fusobacterium varium TaxID=856 RepID=UPI003F11372F
MRIRIKNGKYICNFMLNGTLKVIVSSNTNELYRELGRVLGIDPVAARNGGLI